MAYVEADVDMAVDGFRAKKGKNFTEEEEKQLCVSFLHVSQDPKQGTGQKSVNFWRRITEHYNAHKPKDGGFRPSRSLETKWSIIKHDVAKFVGVYGSVYKLRESGSSLEDVLLQALEVYKLKTSKGTGFPFIHAWKILKEVPRWAETREEARKYDCASAMKRATTTEGLEPGSVERVAEEQGLSGVVEDARFKRLKRPGGCRAAKEEQRQDKVKESALYKQAQATSEMADVARMKAQILMDQAALALFSMPQSDCPLTQEFLLLRKQEEIMRLRKRVAATSKPAAVEVPQTQVPLSDQSDHRDPTTEAYVHAADSSDVHPRDTAVLDERDAIQHDRRDQRQRDCRDSLHRDRRDEEHGDQGDVGHHDRRHFRNRDQGDSEYSECGHRDQGDSVHRRAEGDSGHRRAEGGLGHQRARGDSGHQRPGGDSGHRFRNSEYRDCRGSGRRDEGDSEQRNLIDTEQCNRIDVEQRNLIDVEQRNRVDSNQIFSNQLYQDQVEDDIFHSGTRRSCESHPTRDPQQARDKHQSDPYTHGGRAPFRRFGSPYGRGTRESPVLVLSPTALESAAPLVSDFHLPLVRGTHVVSRQLPPSQGHSSIASSLGFSDRLGFSESRSDDIIQRQSREMENFTSIPVGHVSNFHGFSQPYSLGDFSEKNSETEEDCTNLNLNA